MNDKKYVKSCGFIIVDADNKWLICHSTGNKHWDFPKGVCEDGEDHLQAAIRETIEETGLDMSQEAVTAIDLGCHAYSKHKDVHLFLIKLDDYINLNALECTSFVDRGTYQYPEVDKYLMATPSEAMNLLSNSMSTWVKENGKDLLK